MADSASLVEFKLSIRGRNPRRLISKPTHTPNQWMDERDIIVPNIVTNMKRKLKGSMENIIVEERMELSHPKQS